HEDRMRFLAGARRPAVVADVGRDHGAAVADVHLRAVVLADPDALGEAEGLGQPGNRFPHVGVDQNGHDRRRPDRAVVLHGPSLKGARRSCFVIAPRGTRTWTHDAAAARRRVARSRKSSPVRWARDTTPTRVARPTGRVPGEPVSWSDQDRPWA